MHTLDIHRFTTADAARAAGVPVGTLNAQLHRGDIALADEAPEARNPGTGRSRLFSARRVLHIALTQRLAELGLKIGAASRLALAFSDHNGSDEEAAALADAPMRAPRLLGMPFPDDTTLMQVTFGAEPMTAIRRAADVRSRPPCGGATVAYIDLSHLYETTLARLGVAS